MCKMRTTNKKAFTLAETLVAMIILLMVSSILAAGIPVAKKAYDHVVMKSSAEMLLSTATYALRNELSVASEITVADDNTTITYMSGTYGSYSKIYLDHDKGIMYQRYTVGRSSREEPLVSKAASDDLTIEYESVVPPGSDGFITFMDMRVKDKNGNLLLPESEPENEEDMRNLFITTF